MTIEKMFDDDYKSIDMFSRIGKLEEQVKLLEDKSDVAHAGFLKITELIKASNILIKELHKDKSSGQSLAEKLNA